MSYEFINSIVNHHEFMGLTSVQALGCFSSTPTWRRTRRNKNTVSKTSVTSARPWTSPSTCPTRWKIRKVRSLLSTTTIITFNTCHSRLQSWKRKGITIFCKQRLHLFYCSNNRNSLHLHQTWPPATTASSGWATWTSAWPPAGTRSWTRWRRCVMTSPGHP